MKPACGVQEKHQTEGNSFGDAAFEVPFCFGSNCIFQQLFQTARAKCTKLYGSLTVRSLHRFPFHSVLTP